jgi:hypothetical protein
MLLLNVAAIKSRVSGIQACHGQGKSTAIHHLDLPTVFLPHLGVD